MQGTPQVNLARIAWDLKTRASSERFDEYWTGRQLEFIPKELFSRPDRPLWFEIGAGSGWFFGEMAKLHPEADLVAIERSRLRGKRLERKAKKAGLPNLHGFRGNAIPTLISGVPNESCDRIYILYPCPWVKSSQRKNRWYQHPIMPHLYRILKKDGLLIWASDQRFYIDEARYVCESVYQMPTLAHGEITPNEFNDLAHFPPGRTKFEATFLGQGLSCHELVSRKIDLKAPGAFKS